MAQPASNQNLGYSAQLSETDRMAVIINTAMEGVVCTAYDVFWRIKSVEILPEILRTIALKWVTWIHLVPFVLVDCFFYELACRKVYKSWTKVTQKVC